jgi:hypothetical protein
MRMSIMLLGRRFCMRRVRGHWKLSFAWKLSPTAPVAVPPPPPSLQPGHRPAYERMRAHDRKRVKARKERRHIFSPSGPLLHPASAADGAWGSS